MVASKYKEKWILDRELEEELMKYTMSYEESEVDPVSVEQADKIHAESDAEVDIIGRLEFNGGNERTEADFADTTESSSSFDDSDYEADDFDPLLEPDVSSNTIDGIFSMRKRRLTNHWKAFIKPLMLRCRWVELQIKKLEAQALRYDRELDKYSQRKLGFVKFMAQDLDLAKSIPFSKDCLGSEVFMRKKRKRKEETEDVAAYMSKNRDNGADLKRLAKATKKVDTDDDFLDMDDDLSCGENEDDDNFVEEMFQKADLLQSRVDQLKSRVEKIMNDSSEKFTCADYSSDEEGVMEGTSVGAYVVSQLIAEYESSKFLLPESAVKRWQEVSCDDANERMDCFCFADPTENDDYGVLIDNPRMKEEMDSFNVQYIQPIQRPDMADSIRVLDDQRPLKICSILKGTNQGSTKNRERRGLRVNFNI
ncbi:crooked neck-like protein 1 [Striga asiatica]|uniref:Crooked neck-like protein 1 n=1 Tax=Striga asiatica TaxID=4170 RepID=A0A5A7QMT7_STRAF|nr:crooked neck-like protein 1 [Striga asiatica]